MVHYQISKSELLKQYPDSFADLLAFLTSGEGTRAIYDLSDLYSAVSQLVGLIPKNPQLRILCDELTRLGVSGISKLQQSWIRRTNLVSVFRGLTSVQLWISKRPNFLNTPLALPNSSCYNNKTVESSVASRAF